MEREEWKPIMGYEGVFEVSNFGNIKTLSREVKGYYNRITTERLLRQQKSRDYLTVTLVHNRVRKTRYVHLLVAKEFVPNPNNSPEVNHIDGDKCNPCASNLEWTTRSGNMLHAYATGLQKPLIGEKNPAYGKDYSKCKKRY